MKHKPYRFWLYIAARIAIFIFRLLPRRAALALAEWGGALAYEWLGKYRQTALANLELAYGNEKSYAELETIARGSFINCAKSAADWVLYPRFNRSNWRSVIHWNDELERVGNLLAQGKGLIVVTGHFGNWEMLAASFRLFGFPGAVVGRRIYYEPYNRFIVNARLSKGVKTYYRDDSPRELLKVLRSNQILGIVADQDVDSIEGIFIPFFGKLAYTPVAPARLSIATGAPIVPAFILRNPGDDTYRLVVEEPVYPDASRSREEETLRLTEYWNGAIEKYVRQCPDQWVWMHRRWKTRPEMDLVPS
ncbi:MAG: lysophospholipid acyltransferase family protein [Candidatus Omnitrophica bacterium]|nr:lysophospholipid acyltransferase family protein [Candidatus Omnitrophota bacterium]